MFFRDLVTEMYENWLKNQGLFSVFSLVGGHNNTVTFNVLTLQYRHLLRHFIYFLFFFDSFRGGYYFNQLEYIT